MGNPFVHVELLTSDVAEARKFYTTLFDWKMEDVPGMDYTLIKVGEGTGGDMMKNPTPDTPSSWLPYVFVPDAVELPLKRPNRSGPRSARRSPRYPVSAGSA